MINWLQTQPFYMQLLIVIAGILCINFIVQVLLKILGRRYQDHSNNWMGVLVSALQTPLSVVFWLMGASLMSYLTLDEMGLEYAYFFNQLIIIAFIVCITWFAIRFIRRAERRVTANLQRRIPGRKSFRDEGTLRVLSKSLEVVTLMIGAILILSCLNVSISGLVTFGGVSAAAIAFSTKDMMSNFWGGVMIYLDRPFVVGDSILSPDKEIEGTVESIGWRLTTVRRLDKRPLYVPNSLFTSLCLVNSTRMSHRLINQTLIVRYQDVTVLKPLLKAIRRFLEQHSEVDTNCTILVNIEEFGDATVTILIYASIRTINWAASRNVQDDIMLQVLEILREHGVECTASSNTVYIPGEIKIRSVNEPTQLR